MKNEYSVYGITEKSLSVNKKKINLNNNETININNKIFNFFLFSKEGICILESQIFKIFNDEIQYNRFKLLLKNICHNFFKQIKNYENFIFETIILEKFKITILLKNSLSLVGIFPLLSSKSYQHMLLIHLFIALINYKGDSISKIDSINEQIKYDNNILENIKSLINNNYANNNSQCSFIDNNDLLEILIFQQYFLNLLFSHFTNVYNIIFKRETMNLGGTKLKNIYIIDASTQSIIFDWKQTQNRKNNYKYYKNDLLLKEILFQSNNLYQFYLNSYKNNNTKAKTKYLLLECTSTFPRLLFIFKFIPVLKGLIVIHLYHQKKLSQKKFNNYHEMEITFCSPENHNKNSQEFQYCEPKKLILINKFLEEFYLTTRKTDLFRIISDDKKFKYFNYLAVNAINSVSMKDSINNDIDSIFNIINEKIEEQILENKNNKEIILQTEENTFDKILDINVSNFYKNIYKDNDNNKKDGSNKKKIEFPYNNDNSDINIRYKNDNQSESNYVLTKKNITFVIDNLSDTKTKYYNHLDNIDINNNININSNKKIKDKIIDNEISDSMNLTNIDFVTKNYEKSNSASSHDNYSLISEVEKASNNYLKEIEIHKNNKLNNAKKKGKSNINILDLLDISNMKSCNLNKNASKKIIQESEENRLDNLNDEEKENNLEQLSTSQFNVNEGNNKKYKKMRIKLAIFEGDRHKILSPLKNNPLN